MFDKLREELYEFYLHDDAERAKAFAEKCFKIMDERATEGMSVTAQKLLQYDVICENFIPKIFPHSKFFYEMGVVTSLSDGARQAKGYGFTQANGWVFDRNAHIFIDQDEELYNRRYTQALEKLYNICGKYNDTHQHFNFNFTPYLKEGAKGIYERAKAALLDTKCDEEREFLEAIMRGMLTIKKAAQRFADVADDMLSEISDEERRSNLILISKTASHIPWEAPKTLYEALTTLAFLRSAFGAFEGVGPNTFGRLDVDLIPFYRDDIASGRLTSDGAYDLIREFLILWDSHYDHDMIMSGYADHELENTYTIGGCDDEGKPIYNEITKMCLAATREDKIIFPKIKCRFSKESPEEYLTEINKSIVNGTSTVLLQNDDATIPAIVRAGRPISEARDYRITGCWGMVTNQEKFDHGCYLNLIKPFEYAVHKLYDKMELVKLKFQTFDKCKSFEELYNAVIENCEILLDEKLEVKRLGGQVWHKVDRLPIFSATLEGCIENRRDVTKGGAKYYDDYQLMLGLPNIVDSLMAIKTLVFDKKKYTLEELLFAVRNNWDGFEDMRLEAISCSGWGDGEEESCELAARFNEDLYKMASRKISPQGGRVHIGHLTYTEIRWWGEATLATPDGRRNGEYFAQGLTPSRLKRIPCVNDVINSMACLDGSMMGANSVINIMLPTGIPIDRCNSFLRAVAGTAVQSLQLNCVSRETLIDAQKHPEKYPDLIVRVTGFSAKFTSLSKEWQTEVITRNFYD